MGNEIDSEAYTGKGKKRKEQVEKLRSFSVPGYLDCSSHYNYLNISISLLAK